VAALQIVDAGTTITFWIVNCGGSFCLFDAGNSTASDLVISGTATALGLASDGVCGSANGLTLPAVPSANLCAARAASATSSGGPWDWTCPGTNGGRKASCTANSSAATRC
jgi:hypothetical protein